VRTLNRYYLYIIIISVLLAKASLCFSQTLCQGILQNFLSPVCTEARWIFIPGALIGAGFYYEKHQSQDKVKSHADRKKHMKNWAKISDRVGMGVLNGSYSLLMMIYGYGSGRRYPRRSAEQMIEASLYSQFVTQSLKYSISEERPNKEDDHSFPSGHATAAFAFSSLVMLNHEWYWGLLATGAALAISYGRLELKKHYLHDVIFGATIGMSYGVGIFLNHRYYNKPYWFALAPMPDFKGAQFSMAYKF